MSADPHVTPIPHPMTPLFSLVRRAIPAAALLVAASTARGQSNRDWSVCFGSGVSSCTDLYLSTAPTLGAGGARNGTQMSLLIRQRDRGMPTGLLGFAFGFGAGSGNQTDLMKTALSPFGGAFATPADVAWVLLADRSNSGGLNSFRGFGGYDPTQAPSQTAWIGGCQSPSVNHWWTVESAGCGSGQGFAFYWNTSVLFDADQVETVGVDVVAIDQAALSAGDGGGYCVGAASGGAAVGFDGYDPSNAFPCDITSAGPPETTVPEPGTVVLFAGGLAALAAVRRRRTA